MRSHETIQLDRQSARPLYLQVADALRERICAGEIAAGERLPSERRLAAALGVNRSTVVAAYDELMAAGTVDRHVGRGTTVLAPPVTPLPFAWPATLRGSAGGLGALLDGVDSRDRIALEPGEPSPQLVPAGRLRVLLDELLGELGADALRYLGADGLAELRELVRVEYEAQGVDTSTRRVLITSGAMQAIDLVARAFVGPGDEVAIETPTFPGALDAFRQAGARLVPLPLDRDGIRPDVLERTLSRGAVRLVFTIPVHQNPSGAVATPERLAALLDITRRHRVPVVEDGIYAHAGFDGVVPAPLIAGADSEHVIHLASVTKTLGGGVRVGWVVASPPVIDAMVAIKRHADINTSSLLQHLVARAFERGLVAEVRAAARTHYVERRDALVESIRRRAGDGIRVESPRGGLALWCRLTVPGGARLFAQLATAHGVGVVPGGAFAVADEQDDCFRACFGHHPPEVLAVAGERLGAALEEFRSLGAHPGRASRVLV